MKPRKKIIRKQITFNVEDPEQKQLLEYALSLDNFSGRMKKLLKQDYLRTQQLQNQLKFSNQGGIRFTVGGLQHQSQHSSSATD